jgi:hypothetical protein
VEADSPSPHKSLALRNSESSARRRKKPSFGK